MENSNILIVEDEYIVAQDIKDTLESGGYSVVGISETGEEAIRETAKHYPDMVLMDLKLKGEFDGIETAKKIKTLTDIPVIYVTAYADRKTLERAKTTEPYGYIVKPYNDREIITTVEMALYKYKKDKKLKESEKDLYNTLKSIGDSVIVTNNKGFITFMNHSAEELTGWNLEEAMQKSLGDVFTVINIQNKKIKFNIYDYISKYGKLEEFPNNKILIARNGEEIPIEINVSVIKEKGSSLQGVVLVFHSTIKRNILDVKRAEYKKLLENLIKQKNNQLKEEINKYKRIEKDRKLLADAIEQAEDGFIITDIKGNIQYVNSAFEQMSGYSREEVIGLSPKIWESEAHDEGFYKDLMNKIVYGRSWYEHFRKKRKDGSLFEIAVSVNPIRDAKGNISNYVRIWHDITKEIMMEKQLNQSQKMAAIGTLAGGIAHDFNNILGIILGYTEMVLFDLKGKSAIQEKIEEIFKASIRAKNLVRQILTFSRHEEEKLVPMQVSPVIKEGLKLLRAVIPSTISMQTEINVKTDTIMGNTVQINQVLMNLCINALNAMQNEKGILKVSLTNTDIEKDEIYLDFHLKPGCYLQLSVSDSGQGMDERIKDHIFEPYFTTKKKGEGTGLGLSMVHGIIKNMGGAIEVLSEKGKGTTFNIFLPMANTEVINHSMVSQDILYGNEKILLVDDEKGLVRMEKKMLEKMGYEVNAVTNSMEALQLFMKNKNTFDLVITDLTMPDMNGIELSKAISSIRKNIPIILCSGYGDKGITKDDMKAIGIHKFVMKPLTTKGISKVIREVLDK